ncbi:hypothetical protein C0Q70_17042 [Pomacea canaliculata]|uniref:Uncharacterized protein n=1 Tax=Pomacea canaliculata TaxID=400727 RepID=A0A2T7NRI9_POMCA|nr:hypothetical protein C0Q70_17042 [Pomacea canaliculata]
MCYRAMLLSHVAFPNHQPHSHLHPRGCPAREESMTYDLPRLILLRPFPDTYLPAPGSTINLLSLANCLAETTQLDQSRLCSSLPLLTPPLPPPSSTFLLQFSAVPSFSPSPPAVSGSVSTQSV